MANVTGTARYVPLGVNRGNFYACEVVVPTALSAADTFTMTVPDSVDADTVISVVAYTPSSGAVKALTITTQPNGGGRTVVFTAGTGGVAAGDVIAAVFVGF